MKTPILLRLLLSLRSSASHFANEAAATLENVTDVFVANEAKDGWVQLSPYGRFGNAQGMQEFSREDALSIVNEFESLRNTPQRLLGLPWYIGHPDHPRFKDKYKDTKAYGRIKALDARDDGLFANVKWSAAGEQLVKDEAFHGHSVNWRVKKTGNVFRPISLKSVGFTNEPQIPVAPAMANETQPTENMIPKFLFDMLVAAGLLKADATPTEAEVVSLLQPLLSSPAKLAEAEKAKETAETALANEVTAHIATKGKLTTAETNFANERAARRDVLLSQAERDGRITPADRKQWEGDFANEFDGTATKLAAAKPTLKTGRSTPALSGRGTVSKSKVEVVQEFVNERMTTAKEDYNTAFAWVQKNKPEAFAGMKQPGANAT